MQAKNRTVEYFKLYEKLRDLGYNKVEISRHFNCSRNTLDKIIKKEMIDKNTRIDSLCEIIDELTKEFFDQLDGFEKINQKYIEYTFKYSKTNFKLLSDAFSYSLDYINKSVSENKSRDLEDLVTYINLHMFNFHMRLNPYYYIMRGYFNKELRPIIDFNIDFENKRIIDFQIKTMRTAKYNKLGITKGYRLDYSEEIKRILKGELTERQANEKNVKNINLPQNLDLKNMTFEQFIDLIYLLSIGFSKSYNIRFMVYEDAYLNKFDYIRDSLKEKKYKDRTESIRYYNLARMLNHTKEFMPIEKVFLNYQLDKISGLSRNMYISKIYNDVAFRLNELENLLVMISGLEYKDENPFSYVINSKDEEDKLDDLACYKYRIMEIENLRKIR